MCKTRSITYTCGHSVEFRLSTCAATFQLPKRKSGLKAMCCASPNITLHSLHSCGPCEREAAQQRVQSQLALIEAEFPSLGWTIAPEVEKARSEADQTLWNQFRGLPDSSFKSERLSKLKRGRSNITRPRNSLLRTEVSVDQVFDGREGAKSLSNEIAKMDAERAADSLPPLAPTTSVFEDDNDWGDVTGLGVCEDPSVTTREHLLTARPFTQDDAISFQDVEKQGTAKLAFIPPHRRRRLRESAQANGLRECEHDTLLCSAVCVN